MFFNGNFVFPILIYNIKEFKVIESCASYKRGGGSNAHNWYLKFFYQLFLSKINFDLRYSTLRKMWANFDYVNKGIGKVLWMDNTRILFKRLIQIFKYILYLSKTTLVYLTLDLWWMFEFFIYYYLIFIAPRGIKGL